MSIPNEIKTVVIDRIAHTPVAVNAMLGESDSLLLLYRVSDYGFDDFGIRAGEVFFLMDTGYLVAIIFNELVQAFNSGRLLVIGTEVKNLTHGTIIPGFNLDLNVGHFLE